MEYAIGFILGLLFQALLLSPGLLVVALRIWPGSREASCGIESAKPSIRSGEPSTTEWQPQNGRGPGVGMSDGDWDRL